jgi:hypothetical protein
MNPRQYCGVDGGGKHKNRRKTNVVKPPSIHGERKYKRKTKVEKEKEERETMRDDFLLFLKKEEDNKDDLSSS